MGYHETAEEEEVQARRYHISDGIKHTVAYDQN